LRESKRQTPSSAALKVALRGSLSCQTSRLSAIPSGTCKYHVVCIPKYRRQALSHALRRPLGEVCRALAAQQEGRLAAGHVMGEHVPLLLSMPPPAPVAQVGGCSRGNAAL